MYNLIQQGIRLVHLDLTKIDKEVVLAESQTGNARPAPELLLGSRMRYEQFDEAHHNILSVQDVYLGSPAQEADLIPFKDFVMGTKEMTFTDL